MNLCRKKSITMSPIFLQKKKSKNGGDIALLGIDENNVVYVSFRGACQGCFMAVEDFSSGIKSLILDEVPGVTDVMLV